jgi:hypothetical protein
MTGFFEHGNEPSSHTTILHKTSVTDTSFGNVHVLLGICITCCTNHDRSVSKLTDYGLHDRGSITG